MPDGAAPEGPKLKLMVSSTVYGLQGLLDQVFAMLEGYGYEVWMSHKGTIPTNPRKSNFANCLDAVEGCDFLVALDQTLREDRVCHGCPSVPSAPVNHTGAPTVPRPTDIPPPGFSGYPSSSTDRTLNVPSDRWRSSGS